MNLRTLSLGVVATSLVLASGALTGCAADGDESSVKLGGDVGEQGWTQPAPIISRTGPTDYQPVCPRAPTERPRTRPGQPADTTLTMGDYQANATSVVSYIFNGSDTARVGGVSSPFSLPKMSAASAADCNAALECVDMIRVGLNGGSALNRTGLGSAPWLQALPAVPGTVCGLEAAVIDIKVIDGQWSPAEWDAKVNVCSMHLDACYGVGTSGFFSVVNEPDPNNPSGATKPLIRLDPQPATTTARLGGSNGATAAAVYVNTSTPTNVLKWSAFASYGTAAAGTPCSNSDLAIGDTAYQFIRVTGVLRSCPAP